MKWHNRMAARFYPRGWRDRYGAEFEALLEDTGGRWRDLPDLIGGAVKMRVSTTNWRIGAAFALAGLAAGGVFAWQRPVRYMSEAVLQMRPVQAGEGEAASTGMSRLESIVLSRSSLSGIILQLGLNLYQEERRSLPLEDVIQTMKAKDLKISHAPLLPGTGVIGVRIAYAGRDAAIAQRTVQALIGRLIDQNVQVVPDKTGPAGGRVVPMTLEVLGPATLPSKPTGLNAWLIAALGLSTGLLVWLTVSAVSRRHRTYLGI